MATLDDEQQVLTVKVVYYGPALAGKTTNLAALHDRLSPALKGEMMMLETKNDRTLFFDLLPVGFHSPKGVLVKFKLFTVPGQVAHDSTRKSVLSRADGVVFVADSQRSQITNNAESFENLADNCHRVGIDFETLPVAVQFNKRDLAEIVSEDEVRARWSSTPWPITFASAVKGEGVLSTFAGLLPGVYNGLEKTLGIHTLTGLDCDSFVHSALGQ